MLFLSLFLSLGWFNPVYVAFLKITRLYFFRNPSKFLFFGAFSLSILAGYGFTKFFEAGNGPLKEKAILIFRFIIFGAVILFSAAKILLISFKDKISEFSHYIVKNFIYNTPHHRYSLDYYMTKAGSWYEDLVARMRLSDVFVISSLFLMIIALLVPMIIRNKRIKNICLAVILADIFIFSFYGAGFRGNIRSFEALKPDVPVMLETVKSDNDHRILPFGIKSGKLPNWSVPNANITYGVASTACYTPLAGKAYKKALSGLEVVDDSLGLEMPRKEAIVRNIDILRRLNVKYIVSSGRLNEGFLKEIMHENDLFLYELENAYPRVFFSGFLKDAAWSRETAEIKIDTYKDGLLDLEITNDRDGYVIFSENCYPGWHAYVDGREKGIVGIDGILQAVSIEKGSHKVSFIYKPYSMVLKK
jgi:hypothetical protein